MSSEKAIPESTLRIIDANLNRIGEGLRTIEEMARFMLDDSNLTQQLKSMRHEIAREEGLLHQRLLQSRNSEGDVGANMGAPREEEYKEMPPLEFCNYEDGGA